MSTYKAVALAISIVALIVLTGGLALAFEDCEPGLALENRFERACHRMVASRAAHGQREIETYRYYLDGEHIGVVHGNFVTLTSMDRWTSINWVCRVHRLSGRVVRVEFEWPTSGNRMIAAAMGLQD